MVSFNLLAGGLTMCLVVSLCRCEVNEDNYNKIMTKLNNGLVSERGGSYIKHRNDDIGAKSYPKSSGVYENGTSHKNDYLKEKEMFEISKIQDEEGIGEDSIFMKRIRHIRYFYEKCQRQINQMFKKKLELQKKFKIENNLLKIREKLHSLYNCMKIISFRRLDDFLFDEVTPVTEHSERVKDGSNGTTIFHESKYNSKTYISDILNKNLLDLIAERIKKLFYEQALKIHSNKRVYQVSERGRRRDHRMFAMMMMGFVIMASILVPMGFQFLTVLGGKSLLMAKMALIMSAINGLKKIATSNVGYGLYHAPEAFHHDPHHHDYHEKIFNIKPQEQPNLPFSIKPGHFLISK